MVFLYLIIRKSKYNTVYLYNVKQINNNTMKKEEVMLFLEGLVGQRFNMQSLNDKLEKVFKQKVELQNTSLLREQENDDDDLADYNLMFNIEDGSEQSGFFDIYMLPMRRKGFDGADMYITEVGYEFG